MDKKRWKTAKLPNWRFENSSDGYAGRHVKLLLTVIGSTEEAVEKAAEEAQKIGKRFDEALSS